jgi:CBS domain-containing protein
MTTEVMTLDRNDTLDMADEIMEIGRVRHIPVLSAARVVGVISQRDLFRTALAFALGYGEKARRTLLRTLNVKDVMSQPVVTIGPHASIIEAAGRMLSARVGCLPVVEGDEMIGVLTETDVLQFVAGRGKAVA